MTELESIKMIQDLFERRGYKTNATQSINKFSYYDIEAWKENLDGEKYLKTRIEVKRRYKNFGDMIMEKYKYDNFINDLNNNNIDKGFLVSVFEDSKEIAIEDVTKKTADSKTMARKTTDFENNKEVLKDFVHYKQTYKIKY